LFDNFEHVLPAATFVAELLASAPELKVMVTSRARLELQAEYEYRVDPLPIPDQRSLPPLEGLKQYDGIALFVARAQALRPVFTLTAQNATAVAEIVCRLDGLPLAIELAAARIKLLSPESLLPRLERRLPTLAGGARDLPARQRTLRDTIAWSHDLLHPGEQVLFRRLSVFVGGWTLEGAEAMAAVGGGQPIDALDGLTALVDQSLADQRSLEGVVAQEPRYRMLETIREFARERLVESGEEASIQQAFEQFLLGLIEQAQTGIQGPKQITWLGRLDDEHANIRAALGSALERGDSDAALRIAPPLWEFWRVRGYAREGRDWLERAVALASSADTAGFAAAEFGLGKLSVELGDWAAAEAHYRKSLDAYRRLGSVVAEGEVLSALAMTSLNRRAFDDAKMLGEEALTIAQNASDQRGGATALRILGMIAREQGEYERALELFEESMALWRALGYPAWTARVSYQIGITHRLAGHPEKAQHLLDESRALHAALGDRYGLAVIAIESGHLAFDAGDVKRAVAQYEESLRHYDSLENSEGIVDAIEALATAAAAAGEADSALRLFGSAEAAREALRLPPRFESDEKQVAAGIERAKRAAGDHAAAARAAGKSLSLERARDEALELARSVAGSTNVEP
jgi:predicted ATPase